MSVYFQLALQLMVDLLWCIPMYFISFTFVHTCVTQSCLISSPIICPSVCGNHVLLFYLFQNKYSCPMAIGMCNNVDLCIVDSYNVLCLIISCVF